MIGDADKQTGSTLSPTGILSLLKDSTSEDGVTWSTAKEDDTTSVSLCSPGIEVTKRFKNYIYSSTLNTNAEDQPSY